ncbi:MAG: chemotaxis protein CheB [Coxiellaceae bacterium]|nr:chemotaxis protein CheB [Coxiellaceae bacterium]
MGLAKQHSALAIGVSAGGLQALSCILPSLRENFPLPVFVVQHLSDDPESYLHTHLAHNCHQPVIEPEDKEKIIPGTIYVAPPGYHMEIDDVNTIALSFDPRVNFSRPSIDLLFKSAADIYRGGLICVILTGANSDGAKGIQCAKSLGAVTIAQDPLTAEMATMPQSAIDTKCVDMILPLDDVAKKINQLVEGL